MAMTLGEIVTRYTVDTSGFSSGISKMEQEAKSFDAMSKTHTANFQAAMGRLPGSMTPVQAAVNKTSSSVQSFGNQVQQTASSSSGHFSRIGQSVSSGFGGMVKSVISAGAGIGGWVYAAKSAGEAAVGLGQALFGSSADMEQTTVAFKGLLGSGKAADQMMRDLQAFAAKTPFEFPELAKDTQMLMGMGVASRDVIPWMTAIGDAAAGIGSGSEGAAQITRALGQMQAKGKIAGDEMMQLQEGGINGYKLLAQSMGIPEAEVRKLGDAGKLGQNEINLLVKGMEKMYGGQMQAQAGTMNGLLSTLKDNAGAALRAFVGPLFEQAKGGLTNLVSLFSSPAFTNFASGVGKTLGDTIATMAKWLGEFYARLSSNGTFQAFVAIAQNLGTVLSGVVNTALALFGVNLDSVSSKSGGASSGAANVADGIKRIADIGAGVTSFLAGVAKLFSDTGVTGSILRGVLITIAGTLIAIKVINFATHVAEIGASVASVIGSFAQWAVQSGIVAAKMLILKAVQIGSSIASLVAAIPAMVGGFIAWAVSAGAAAVATIAATWPILLIIAAIAAVIAIIVLLVKNWDAVVKFIQGAWTTAINWLGTTLGNIGKWFTDAFNGIWKAVSVPLTNIWNAIVNTFSPIVTFISDVMRIIGGILSLGWSIIWGQISGFLTNIWKSIVSVWNSITSFIGAVITTIWNKITSVWNAIWSTISGVLSRIWNTISSVWNTIWNFLSGIITTIWNAEVRGWTNIWNSITSFLGRIWSTITSIWNNIKSYIGSVLGTILSTVGNIWNTIWNTITGFVNRIWNTITSTFNRIRDTVGGIFRGMINNIISWLNPGLNAISNFLNFFINGINRVSQFFIKKDLLGTVHLGPIGYLAHGTHDWRGGMAIVGEEGPELVSLPKHAAVLPHNESEDWLAGRTKFPSFAGGVGDFMGNIFSWITGSVGGIADNVMKNVFGGAPSLGVFGDIAGSLLSKVAGWLGQWIKDNISSLFGSFTGTLPAMQQGQFLLPRNLGFPGYPGHHGMDFQFPQGSPVTEIVGGTVSPHTGWYSFGGEIDVLIDRIAGMWERYLHMSQIFVQGGQRVNRGDLIGLSGGGTVASGLGRGSNGAHLHLQYDWGNYSNFVPPLNVWSALGMFDPFMLAGQGKGPSGRNRAYQKGGLINEQVMGIGASSGKGYSFGEYGVESVVPASAQERQAQALERIERLLANDGRITEYQITQALGRLLANGVR